MSLTWWRSSPAFTAHALRKLSFQQGDVPGFSAEEANLVRKAVQEVKGPQNLQPVSELDTGRPFFHGQQGVGADACLGRHIRLRQAARFTGDTNAAGEREQHVLRFKRKSTGGRRNSPEPCQA